jgi:uncharacterized protein YbjT (DUF2867 family)
VVTSVFITGGTGYLGQPLIAALLKRGHTVHALARSQSASRLPAGAVPVIGNALDAATFAGAIPPGATFVHLVGTPHPNPAKAAEFRRVDLESIKASATAARQSGIRHFVYLSVAHPAPVMHAYIAVRKEGEALVRASGLRATLVRPWYVLGRGHWWPIVLLPLYGILRWIPSTRSGAERLGLVTREQMIRALVHAVEQPPAELVRTMDVPDIRRAAR